MRTDEELVKMTDDYFDLVDRANMISKHNYNCFFRVDYTVNRTNVNRKDTSAKSVKNIK